MIINAAAFVMLIMTMWLIRIITYNLNTNVKIIECTRQIVERFNLKSTCIFIVEFYKCNANRQTLIRYKNNSIPQFSLNVCSIHFLRAGSKLFYRLQIVLLEYHKCNNVTIRVVYNTRNYMYFVIIDTRVIPPDMITFFRCNHKWRVLSVQL